jgi:predicted enzyme related to lactoylglutathione lyase
VIVDTSPSYPVAVGLPIPCRELSDRFGGRTIGGMTNTAEMTRSRLGTAHRSDAGRGGVAGESWVPGRAIREGRSITSIHPVVSTPDLRRLRAFYEKVLGATQTMRVPDKGRLFYVELRIGQTALGLVQKKNTETGAPVRIVLSAEVPDIDALLPTVESAGGTVRDQPKNMPWGQRVAHVLDPDGNMLNLTTYLQRDS